MTNITLIETALTNAVTYCEIHHVSTDTNSLMERILDWYNHTDITNAEVLAAAALEFPTFEQLPFSILEEVANIYFPQFSIYEETDTRFDF